MRKDEIFENLYLHNYIRGGELLSCEFTDDSSPIYCAKNSSETTAIRIIYLNVEVPKCSTRNRSICSYNRTTPLNACAGERARTRPGPSTVSKPAASVARNISPLMSAIVLSRSSRSTIRQRFDSATMRQ